MGVLSLWFGFSERVTRKTYLATGVGLMAAKYALDAGLVYAGTGQLYGPHQFVNPILTERMNALSPAPQWVLVGLVLIALPFAWIGLSMSLRRALDAGVSPWLGLLFLVPILNYALMLLLAVVPSRRDDLWPVNSPVVTHYEQLKSAMLGLAVALGIGGAMLGISVYALDSYGGGLFFLAPALMGACAGYLHNLGHPRTVWSTLAVAATSVILGAGLLLLFALEGVLCLSMAIPLALPMALLGAVAGRALAVTRLGTSLPAVLSVLALPLLTAAEAALFDPPEWEVTTSVEVTAPPEVVWPHVIAFSPLEPPKDWFFRAGIAYPTGATIEGEGVGAVRRCEFSTGAFVEPITAWEPPHRLAFDVAAQPPPMAEWSPWRHVTPPHLDGYMASRRGEFRLIPLPGGRTRLEGSTWYSLDMGPTLYWRVWAEALLHAIHGRVLEHIVARAEASGAAPSS